MKKVLIAIDYHPTSEKVAEEGHRLAKKLGASTCLIHVRAESSYYNISYQSFFGYEGMTAATPDPALAADPSFAKDPSLPSEVEKTTDDFLKSAARHLDDSTVETHMAEGDTDKAILEYAAEWNADIIVMGTHSRSGLEKLLMGNITAKVLEKTKVPMYMVPVKK